MAALAWPLCISTALLVFAVIFVYMFRKEISRFIDRTQKITKEGVEAGTSDIATQQIKAVAKPSPADQLLQHFDNQLLVEQEDIIRKYLEEMQIHNPAEEERVLIRYLASSYIVQKFENVYYNIWGSQLRALHLLNESAPQGIVLQALEPWYELGKTVEPNWYATYTFEQWYGFMEERTLVIIRAGIIHITVFGNEFLRYVIQCAYSLNKRG